MYVWGPAVDGKVSFWRPGWNVISTNHSLKLFTTNLPPPSTIATMSSEHGLAVGRSRRGNAGDKLAELMAAGLQPDDMFPEEANDNEFEAAGGTS